MQTDSTTLHVVDNATSTQISALHPSYQYEILVAAVTIAAGPYSSTAISIQLPESGVIDIQIVHVGIIFFIQHQVVIL